MSTPVITKPAEAEAIRRGWDTYRRVMNAEWPEADRDAIREALDGLLGTLETWSDVLNEDTHPATAYPELEHEDDAYDKALTMTAQDVRGLGCGTGPAGAGRGCPRHGKREAA